jgi:hypothetical protein
MGLQAGQRSELTAQRGGRGTARRRLSTDTSRAMISVSVTTPPLGDDARSWRHLAELLEDAGIEVADLGLNDDGTGAAELHVPADGEGEALDAVRRAIAQHFGAVVGDGLEVRSEQTADDEPAETATPVDAMRWVREPVAWTRFGEGGGERRVRIFYTQTGGVDLIAEVVVAESAQTVAVSLFQRALDHPDASEKAVAAARGVEVELAEPLGERRLIDGTTGIEAQRTGEAAPEICPLWVP